MIYFIQAGESGPIKIGYTLGTDNFKHRFRMLQTGNHEELKLLKLIAGERDLERSLHASFIRYREGSEWFRATRYLLEIIETHAAVEVCEPPGTGSAKLW